MCSRGVLYKSYFKRMLMKSIGVFSNEPRNIGAFRSKPVCGKVEGALAGKGRLAQIVHGKKIA